MVYRFPVYKNKEAIVSLYNGKIDDLGNRWFIGQPLNSFYDFKKAGIWQLGEEELAKSFGSRVGQIRVQDTNGDGKTTADDRVLIGSDVPDFSAGMTNRFSYKNFDLSFSCLVVSETLLFQASTKTTMHWQVVINK